MKYIHTIFNGYPTSTITFDTRTTTTKRYNSQKKCS